MKGNSYQSESDEVRSVDGTFLPEVIRDDVDRQFRIKANEMGLDPDSRWVGGYLAYEWTHLRPLLAAYGIRLANLKVLEFGCNVGASAIVYSTLGADVTAVDTSEDWVALARLNARRTGRDKIDFRCVPDTKALPFRDQEFDLINCNSVLEYVSSNSIKAVQRELDRVLKVDGCIVVTGTSSRLWPKEIHTERWGINYVPRPIDRMLGLATERQRGIWPWTVRYGFGKFYRNLDSCDRARAFLASRAMMTPRNDGWPVRVVAWLGAVTGVGPGLIAPNISCVLVKHRRFCDADRAY